MREEWYGIPHPW